MQKDFRTLLNTSGVATVAGNAATWLDVSDMEFPIALIVAGSGASDGITIAVSDDITLTSVAGGPNQYGPPPAATLGTPISAAITADGVVTIAAPVGYIKAYKPAATQSSTVKVLLRASRH